MGPEGKIEAYLKRRVAQTRGRIRKLRWVGRNGAPDRMIWWVDGLMPSVFFVELKSAKGRLSKLQKKEHNSLLKDGFRVEVIDSKEGVDNFINETEAYRT